MNWSEVAAQMTSLEGVLSCCWGRRRGARLVLVQGPIHSNGTSVLPLKLMGRILQTQ